MRIVTGDYLYILPYMRSNPHVSQQFHDELSKLVDVSRGPDDVETLPMVIIFRPTGRPDDEFVENVIEFIQDRQDKHRDKILITALSASRQGQTFTPKVYAHAFKAIWTISVSSGSLDVRASQTTIASLASLFITQYGCKTKRRESPKPAREERIFASPSDTYRSSGYMQRKRESDRVDNTHISQKMQRTSLYTTNIRTDNDEPRSTERISGSRSTDDVSMVESSDVVYKPVFPDVSEETHKNVQENTPEKNVEDTPQENVQKTQSLFSWLTSYLVPKEEPVTVLSELTAQREPSPQPSHPQDSINSSSKLDVLSEQTRHESLLSSYLLKRAAAESVSESHIPLDEEEQSIQPSYISHQSPKTEIVQLKSRDTEWTSDSGYTEGDEQAIRKESPCNSEDLSMTHQAMDTHVPQYQTSHSGIIMEQPQRDFVPVQINVGVQTRLSYPEAVSKRESSLQKEQRTSHTGFGDRGRSYIPRPVSQHHTNTPRKQDSRSSDIGVMTTLPSIGTDEVKTRIKDQEVLQEALTDMEDGNDSLQIAVEKKFGIRIGCLPRVIRSVLKEVKITPGVKQSATITDFMQPQITKKIEDEFHISHWSLKSVIKDVIKSTLELQARKTQDEESRGILNEAKTYMEEEENPVQTSIETKYGVRPGYLPRILATILGEAEKRSTVPATSDAADFLPFGVQVKIENNYGLLRGSIKGIIHDTMEQYLKMRTTVVKMEHDRDTLQNVLARMDSGDETVQRPVESRCNIRPGLLPRILRRILADLKEKTTDAASSVTPQVRKRITLELSQASEEEIVEHYVKQHQELKEKTTDAVSSVTPYVKERITHELSKASKDETVEQYAQQHQKISSSSLSRMDTGEQYRTEYADVVTVQPQSQRHGIAIRQTDHTVQRHTSHQKEVTLSKPWLDPHEGETRIKDQDVLQEALSDMNGGLSPVQFTVARKFSLRSDILPQIIRSTLKEVKIKSKVKQSATLTDCLQPEVKRKIEDQFRINRGSLKDVIKFTLKLQKIKPEHEETRGILTEAKSYLEQIKGANGDASPMVTNLESKCKIKHGELCRVLTAILQEAKNEKTVPVTSDAKDFLPANKQEKIEKTFKLRGSVKGIIEETLKQYLKIQTFKLKMEHEMDTLREVLSEIEEGNETTKRAVSWKCDIKPERVPAILRISLADLEKRTPDAGSPVPPHVGKRITLERRHGSVEDTVVDYVKKYLKRKAENEQKDRVLLEALQEAPGKMEEGDIGKQKKVEDKFHLRPGLLPRVLRCAKEELEERYPSDGISADVSMWSVQHGIEKQFQLSEGSLKDIITAVTKKKSGCTIQ